MALDQAEAVANVVLDCDARHHAVLGNMSLYSLCVTFRLSEWGVVGMSRDGEPTLYQ